MIGIERRSATDGLAPLARDGVRLDRMVGSRRNPRGRGGSVRHGR
jgi:hypothetical protein